LKSQFLILSLAHCHQQAGELVLSQSLVAEPAVDAFGVSVLHWLAGLDDTQLLAERAG
jgi:hypothetical protein